MKLIDLFSGIGGFSLAAHWMGWETIAFCEQDKFCQKVLRKNFDNNIPIYDDVRTFPGESFRGRCDIITGGFPCQGQSSAGKRKGKNDDRYLFPEMLRVVDEVRPTWVVPENVRGLLSIDNGRLFEEICSSLESIGYAVQTFCIPACSVNALHRRDRLWIIANAQHERRNNWGGTKAERNHYHNGRTAEAGRDRGVGRILAHSRSAGSITADANGSGSQGRNSQELQERSEQWTSRTRSPYVSDSAIERLPNWSGGALGQPFPVTEFERPSGREIERDFRGMAHGVSRRVDRLKSLGNSIVPQIAYEIFRAIEAAEQ